MNKTPSKMILNHQKIFFTLVVVFTFLFASCVFFGEAKCNLTPLLYAHTQKTHTHARAQECNLP